MIVRDKPSPFLLFFIIRGSIVTLIFPQIVFITLLGGVVVAVQHYFPAMLPSYSPAPFALFGIALSLFLGFRNNACYERWWEARKQWGQLMLASRTLARQVNSFIGEQDVGKQGIGVVRGIDAHKEIIGLTIAFTHALKHQLRGSEAWDDIRKYIDPADLQELQQSTNIPNSLLNLLALKLIKYRNEGFLSDILVQSIDQQLTSMSGVLAACERIQNTPLPFAYMLLVHRTAYLYCFILPFGLVTSLGWVTPLICAIIAYTIFGLDALSEELEKPFGLTPNALPLGALSRTIEINLLEALGEKDLPPQLMPVGQVLQ